MRTQELPSTDLDITDPTPGESPSGFGGTPHGPAVYEVILTGIFAISPFIALALLILADIGFPWYAVILTAVLIVIFGHGITIINLKVGNIDDAVIAEGIKMFGDEVLPHIRHL